VEKGSEDPTPAPSVKGDPISTEDEEDRVHTVIKVYVDYDAYGEIIQERSYVTTNEPYNISILNEPNYEVTSLAVSTTDRSGLTNGGPTDTTWEEWMQDNGILFP
jgi:hypothetical protein